MSKSRSVSLMLVTLVAPMVLATEVQDYRLQSGENLRKLSEMLYGDAAYWPKVWADSKEVTNPHLVRPGHTLQFRMGSEDQLPAFRFSEDNEGPNSRARSNGLQLAQSSEDLQIDIPPPEEPSRPLIKIPPSFPAWQEVFTKAADSFTTDYSGIKPNIRKTSETIFLTGYAQERELKPAGYFLETEGQSALPVEMQYVYVKMKPGQGQIGSSYLIVRDMGLLKKANDLIEDRVKANLIRVFGEVELTDKIQDRKRETAEFEVFRALITRAIDLTLFEFALIPGSLQQVSLANSGPMGNIRTQILGSHKHTASLLYGPGDIVFLNKGGQQGVVHGQLLNIFTNRIGNNRGTSVTNGLVPSGVVKVVKVDNNVSTAVVVSATDGLQQGDFVQEHANAVSVDPSKDPNEYDESEADGDFDEE